jgi:glycosyltransferase involved in cell wall biosynthesis
MVSLGLNVSVAVPVFNGEKFVESCIKSVLSQSYKPYEVIVVDDGSSDSTSEIASRYPVRLVRHDKNMGLAEARNTAICSAKGDIVAFLDVDCVAGGDWLQNIVDNYREHDAVGVGGQGVEVSRKGYANMYRSLHSAQGHGDKKRDDIDTLFGLCSSYKRESLLKIGLYDPIFRTNGEDVDMSLRILKAGGRIVYDPSVVVYHQRTDSIRSFLKTAGKAYYWGSLAFLKNSENKMWQMLKITLYPSKVFFLSIIRDIKRGSLVLIPMAFGVLAMQTYFTLKLYRWYLKG